MNFKDTVAAISTPRGKGGVALIRISGDEAIAVAERAFLPKNGKRLSDVESGRAVYGTIIGRDANGDTTEIDDGIATIFRAPHSFTGEDTVEISCHGGILVTTEVLEAILAAGARPAEAGEFTRRAFLSGKLGLSQAEALGSLLEADTHAKLRLSRSGLSGKVETATRGLYDILCHILSNLYAIIDYPDEDLGSLSSAEVRSSLLDILNQVNSLAATYKSGRAILEGISTVLCGKPNVGKSSLYNRIVGRDAAIVTEIAGTTRDLLEATASFGGVTLRLCDTAGLHDADDVVESIGVDRAKQKLAAAELILAVFDASRPLDNEDEALLALLAPLPAKKLALLNKSDKSAQMDATRLAGHFDNVIATCATTEDGLHTLAEEVNKLFLDGSLNLSCDPVVATARQYASLCRASEALKNAIESIDAGLCEDLYAADVETAMQALSELDGREVSEDVVSGIFSHFCVGK